MRGGRASRVISQGRALFLVGLAFSRLQLARRCQMGLASPWQKSRADSNGQKTRRVGTVRRHMPGTVPYNIFTDGLWAQAWPLTGAAAFSSGAHAAKKLAFCPRPPSFASDRRIFCHSALCICNLAAQPTQVPLPFPPSSSSGRRRRRAPGEYETTGTFFSLLSTMAADRWIL